MERPLVVFVPGFMQRGDAWAQVARRVGERYPTHSLDSVAEAPPRGCVVAGYSMGGRMALRLAVAEPERFSAVVTVGSGAGIEGDDERRARREADLELADWMEGWSIEEVVARWESMPVFADQPAELVDRQRPGRLSHSPAELAELLRTAGQGAFEPVWDRIPSLPMPLLAMAGERDSNYVAAAERLAELAPRGRAAVIPDAGHAAHLEQPEAVADELIRLLGRELLHDDLP